MEVILSHPAIGVSWESFVIENISRAMISHYWSATKIEVDLILQTPCSKTWAIEIKHSSALNMSSGLCEAYRDIQAVKKIVVVPESEGYLLKCGAYGIGLI